MVTRGARSGRVDSPGIERGGLAVNADRAGRLSVWIYIGWMATSVFEGPLRGGLAAVGLANLLYLRDLVVVGTIVLAFASPWTRGTPPAPGLFLMGWLLALHLCIGILWSGALFTSFFGLKMFLPILYTMAISRAVQKNFLLFVRAMAVFFGVSVFGVMLNAVIGEFPWEGLSYDTAFGSVQTTKKWWMEVGLRRLPGFARTSVDAAMIIGVSAIIVVALIEARWLRLLVVALAGYAIVLSTSKGMVLAFTVAALWLVPASRSPRSLDCGRWIAAVLLLLTCAVPAIFIVVSVPLSPPEIPPLLISLWERFSSMWPLAFATLPDGFGALTGAGLGSIGTPLGILPFANSADSIFVYCYVSFGLISLVYLAFPMMATLARTHEAQRQTFAWAGLLIIAYGYGLSTNMIEAPFFTSVFGLIYAQAFSASARARGSE